MSEPPVNVSAEGVHAEPRKVGHRLVDFSIALSAIVISLISLAVAIHHGRVQERLVAANSWPFLFWSTSIDQDERGQRFSIYIANSGVGPALLKGLVVRYSGKPVRGWVELLQECCGVDRQAEVDPPSLGFFTGGRAKGVIAARESRTLLSLTRLPQNPQLWERLMAAPHAWRSSSKPATAPSSMSAGNPTCAGCSRRPSTSARRVPTTTSSSAPASTSAAFCRC